MKESIFALTREQHAEITAGRGAVCPNCGAPITRATAGAALVRRKLDESQRREILRRLGEGESQSDLAREFGVHRALICRMAKKST